MGSWNKWDDFKFEVEWGAKEAWKWIKEHDSQSQVIFNMIMLVILLVVLSKSSALRAGDMVIYNVVGGPAENSTEISLEDVVKDECERQGVDEKIAIAIMNSDNPEDGVERVGIMKLHPALKKDEHVNISSGVSRLKWCLDKNKSIDGALMVYIYTEPIAQEMWKEGIRTTMWVEEVKARLI